MQNANILKTYQVEKNTETLLFSFCKCCFLAHGHTLYMVIYHGHFHICHQNWH